MLATQSDAGSHASELLGDAIRRLTRGLHFVVSDSCPRLILTWGLHIVVSDSCPRLILTRGLHIVVSVFCPRLDLPRRLDIWTSDVSDIVVGDFCLPLH